MTLRKKSRTAAPVPQPVEDSDAASVFEESVPVGATLESVPLEPVRPTRKVLGMKRKSVETLDGDVAKRKPGQRTDDIPEEGEKAPIPSDIGTSVRLITTVPRLTEPIPKLTETTMPKLAAPIPKHTQVACILPMDNDPIEYKFSIRPVMGPSFEVKLTSDSSVFDLKDAIFTKTGMIPEMQLLSHNHLTIRFEEEEKFLDELPIPRECTLNLSVKAASGLSLMNMGGIETLGEEDFFIYDVLPLSPGPETSDTEVEEPFEHSKKLRLCIPISTAVATASLPFPVLDSYIKSRQSTVEEDNKVNEDKANEDKAKVIPTLKSRQGIAEEENMAKVIPTLKSRQSTTEDENKVIHTLTDLSALRICSDHKVDEPPSDITVKVLLDVPKRCGECGRRCRIALQFKCRCGGVFCQAHRYGDQHRCSFDFQSFDRSRLQESNPKVTKPQVDEI